MSRKPKIEATRLNAINSSRALKRLSLLVAEVQQIYWDTFIELMGVPPDRRDTPVANSQPAESKREKP
jgi:hypothetical protein